MLSADLTNLSRNLAIKAATIGIADPFHGYLMRVAESLQDLRDQAEQLEKSGVRPMTVIDLSDDKIVLFPVIKRPVPIGNGGAA